MRYSLCPCFETKIKNKIVRKKKKIRMDYLKKIYEEGVKKLNKDISMEKIIKEVREIKTYL